MQILCTFIYTRKNSHRHLTSYSTLTETLTLLYLWSSQNLIQQISLVCPFSELKYIQELLKTDSSVMIGNGALVVSHCTQVAGLSSSLVHSGIIKTLLSNTDSSDEFVKQNCAIAVAKLATTDQRFVEVCFAS